MKLATFSLAAFLVSSAEGKGSSGPRFSINVNDPSLPEGVGSLGLEGEYSREISENFNAGVKYNYNSNKGLPSSIWVSSTTEVDEDTTISARAEYDVNTKSTVIDASFTKGGDSAAIDFDTSSNEVGPLRIQKSLNCQGKLLTFKPKINLKGKTGQLAIHSVIEEDKTSAEITVNKEDESASLEVSHRIDDFNVISPKVNLRSGDVSVRLNRSLENGGAIEINANRENVDWELNESDWIVKGNIPLDDKGASTISFKRSITLN